MVQPGSEFNVSMVQVMPAPEGSESETVTLFATPSPLFEIVIVNPIGLPAPTEDMSATLVIPRFGQLTVIEADPELLLVFASLLAVTLAELLIGAPQVSAVVAETI